MNALLLLSVLAVPVRVVGNTAFSEAILLKVADAASTPEEAATLMTKYYNEHGYLVGKAMLTRDGDRVLLSVDEGPPFQIGKLEFVEVTAQRPLTGSEQLVSLVKVHSGDVFDQKKLLEATEVVKDHYDGAGYGLATVEPVSDLDISHHLVNLRFEVNRGARYTIGAVDVFGAPPDPVRKLFGLKIGAVYSRNTERTGLARVRAKYPLAIVTLEKNKANPTALRLRITLP